MKKIVLIILAITTLTFAYSQSFYVCDSLFTDIEESGKMDIMIPSCDSNFYVLIFSREQRNKMQLVKIFPDASFKVYPVPKFLLDKRDEVISGQMYKNKLYLYCSDGYIRIFNHTNEKFRLKKKIYARSPYRKFESITVVNDSIILLMNGYNFKYEPVSKHDNYAMRIFDIKNNKIVADKEIDLGKGIELAYYSRYSLIESNGKNILLAHPTRPEIYIFNLNLQCTDTIHCRFTTHVNYDSIVNTLLTESLMHPYNTYGRIQFFQNSDILDYEKIEKVFFISNDIIGYTIEQDNVDPTYGNSHFKRDKIFVTYSLSQKKELSYMPTPFESIVARNFTSSGRILIKNNKTIHFDCYEKNEKVYYRFNIYCQ